MMKGQETWLEITDNIKIDQLLFLGPKEIMKIKNDCHNPFWRDVCKAAIRLHNLLVYETPGYIRKAPIWGNPLIKKDTCKALMKRGIREVGDLFNEDSNILLLNSSKTKRAERFHL